MTIDEAIRQLENAPATIYSTYYPDFPEAMRLAQAVRLGIEALKRLKDLRSIGAMSSGVVLPGETEI